MQHFDKSSQLKNRLFKSVAGVFGIKIAATFLGLCTSILLAHILGAEGLGIYASVITWTSLLSIPATLGLDRLLIREVAIYQTQSAWGLMRGLLHWANRIILLVSIGLAGAAAGITWVLGNTSSQIQLAFWVALVSLPIASLRNLRLATMKGLNQVVKGLLPELIIAPVLAIASIIGTNWLLDRTLTATYAVTIHVVAVSITFVLGTRWLDRALPKVVEKTTPEYRVKDWINSGLPLMLTGGMQIINTRADILMLGVLDGSESVGIYVVVSRGTQLIAFMLMAVNSVLGPTIASLYSEGKMLQLQQIVTKTSRTVLAIALPMTILLIGLRINFLSLFGSEFVAGENALIILSIGQLVKAATGSSGWLLTMTGNERYTALSVGISATLNVIGNATLIPIWGIDGAAIATASSLVIVNILKMAWVQKKIGIDSTAWGRII